MERRSEEAAQGALSFTIDGALIRVTGTGFWPDAEIDAHFRALRRAVAAARPHHARFKVLVDLRASAVQARDTADRIERDTRALWTPADRVAMVIHAGLARMQMNRIIEGRAYQVFDEIDLARQWLDRA